MTKRSPKDVWQDLVDEAGEAEIERAASVSVEQAEKELRAAGFDVAAERAKAEAFLDELARPAAKSAAGEHAQAAMAPVVSIAKAREPAAAARRTQRRPVVFWLAAAAGVAVAGGGLWYATHAQSPDNVTHGGPSAGELRRDAAAACAAGRFRECVSLLDRARDEDPAGDSAAEVQRLRALALRALEDGAHP